MLRLFGILGLLCSSLLFGKVYDCFMFFNEYEVLDIRFHELYDHVDHFVIVESCETHGGNEKTFRFEENLDRYAPFLDKVIYIKLEERLQTQDPWVRERWQRDQIMRALVDCSPDDVIMISDCDEIMPGEMVATVVEDLKQQKVVGFIQTLCAFCLNRHWTECHEYEWKGSACTYYDNLQTTTPSQLRELVHLIPDNTVYWEKGGWHFSYMGGFQRNIEKCNNFAHCNDTDEDYDPEYEEWRAHINTFTLVPIDDSYPQYVQDNVDHLIDIGLVDPY